MMTNPRVRIEWFRQLIESNGEPISIVSVSSGRFVGVNSAFFRMTGFNARETISKTPFEMGFLVDRTAYARFLRSPTAENGYEFECRTKEGQVRLAQTTTIAIDVAGQACLVVIWRDITERKQFENDMARARDLALESARLKSEFLSNISHELRTPLNGIVGMSQLLIDTALSREQREYANTIETCSGILLKLVCDILDFSKVSSGQLRFEEISFNLRDVVETVVALCAVQAAAKNLELTSTIDTSIQSELIGDPHRLGEILTNLVNNAVKFTESGAVTVSVALQKLTNDSTILRFEVRDTGIGISRANLDRVFQPFVQADGSTTRKYGGTGLGLAICAKLVTLMNGNIGVVSSPGLGSTFHFTARFGHPRSEPDQSSATLQDLCSPAQDANMPLPASETSDQADREQVRILVVEDVMVNQLVMRRQLEKLGYTNVGNAENGLEALETLAKTTYDIVLMDCEMPVLDGREATIRFRRNEQGQRHTPVIAITAKALADDREKCVAAGMDDYISKPIRLEELAGVLDRWRPRVEKAVQTRSQSVIRANA